MVPVRGGGPTVSAALLTTLATVGRDHERPHSPPAAVADHPHPADLLEPVDDHTCLLRTGADTLRTLAFHVAGIGVDFDILDPPELRTHVRELADRCRRSAQRRQ